METVVIITVVWMLSVSPLYVCVAMNKWEN